MIEFKIPEVGENIDTGTVISLAVSTGDTVQKDQDLLELETDKATIPIPSPCDGTIKKIFVKKGDEIKIGQTVMTIDEVSSDAISKEEVPSRKITSAKKETHEQETSVPIVSPQPQTTQRSPSFHPLSNEQIEAQTNVPAAPTVRRFARELGVEVSRVPGSGPGGRISKGDVKSYVKQILSTGAIRTETTAAPQPLPDFSKWGTIKREKMSNIRKTTAKHLSTCWQTIPHVTQFDKADITELDKLRKERSTPERKLTITPFLMKIIAAALKEFPQFNASIDMETQEIIFKDYLNLGVAVDTDRGLLVPVIRDVDQKDVFTLADELNGAAQKARDRKISLDDLRGGSITITNLGGIGGTFFTPIINWPEVAILGISRGEWEPVWNKENFVPRFKLPLSLSYDHRLVDGADGARFIRWICQELEKPFPLKK